MFSHNCGNAWKKIRRGNSIYLISLSWDILKTNMICGIFMTKERIVEMNIARFSKENICRTDWLGERRIPKHTQKAKEGELWNCSSAEEVFSLDTEDNFGKELNILVSCTTLQIGWIFGNVPKGGGVIFNLIQNSNFRVQGMVFFSTIVLRKIKKRHTFCIY